MVEPTWKPGDPPYRLGDDGPSRAKKGTLAWYQPSRQCHAIAFFAMAIGVINYPKLRWKFVSGRCHTVPVGYDENGQARVVMDILLFEDMTAEESIRFALLRKDSAGRKLFSGFATKVVPAIRETLASKAPVSDEPCRQALSAYLQRCIKRAAAKSKNRRTSQVDGSDRNLGDVGLRERSPPTDRLAAALMEIAVQVQAAKSSRPCHYGEV